MAKNPQKLINNHEDLEVSRVALETALTRILRFSKVFFDEEKSRSSPKKTQDWNEFPLSPDFPISSSVLTENETALP